MTTIDIITRDQWGARPPKRRLAIDTPTRELWLHHTAGSHRAAPGMRAIQNFHMDTRGWSDIAYSFVIDPITLHVYEARGAGIAGGHTAGHNTHSHAICIMGNFETQRPSQRLLDRTAQLVAYGHEQGWWPPKLTGGHRDASGANTLCPGRHLHRQIDVINQLAQRQDNTTDMKPYQIQAVTQIQQALDAAGYNLGPAGVDGDPGPATSRAVRQALNDLTQCQDAVDDAVQILNPIRD